MRKSISLVLLFIGLIAGCAPSYTSEFNKMAEEEKWNEEQQLAARYFSYRLYFLKEKADHSDYDIIWSRLTKTRVREKIDESLQILDDLLSYKFEEDNKYVDWVPGMREELKHQEKVTKALWDRIRVAEVFDEFRKLTGDLSVEHSHSDYGGGYDSGDSGYYEEKIKGYNAQQIFLKKDLSETFPFVISQIEEAKKNGKLQIIETGRFMTNRRFDHKEPDPANLEDPNKFVWKSKVVGLELKNYKILDTDKPENNKGNFVEGYRILAADNGKEEKEIKPCLRIFYVNSDNSGVMVLDTDRQGEPGHGLPDVINGVYGLNSVSDIPNTNSLINILFKDKNENRRIPPKQKPITMEIVRAKEPLNVWEDAPTPDGWVVPFKYKNELASNYNVKIVWDKIDHAKPFTGLRKIKYFKLEWTGGNRYVPSVGAVVTYHHPKPEFTTVREASIVYVEDTKKIRIIIQDGTEVSAYLMFGENKFSEKDPVIIDFSEGEKRRRIMKEDSNVFNKRKEISTSLQDQTGRYSFSEDTADKLEMVDDPSCCEGHND